jgi:phosphatidylserine/phosphatidylglycerophosphate/cardiolipin synthase-like enzyme
MASCFLLGWCVRPIYQTHPQLANRISVRFSPDGGTKQALIEHIRDAKSELLIALYYFTDPDLADAVIQAHRRNVAVAVILDKSQRKGRYSQARRLRDEGVPLAFDTAHRIFHHKFMIVDALTVVTGSHNWTKSAETVNAENTLILQNVPLLAQKYRMEFQALYARAAKSRESEGGNHLIHNEGDIGAIHLQLPNARSQSTHNQPILMRPFSAAGNFASLQLLVK